MSRPFKNRKVVNPPVLGGFRPFGIPMSELKSIKLQIDEYESICLVNYKNMHQEEAAKRMNVSRPTLTRIHDKALKKIAKAFVECLIIEIEGGNVEFEKEWYKCKRCFKLIEGLENHIKCLNCTSFGKDELVSFNQIKGK